MDSDDCAGYDAECEKIREALDADGCVLIVFGGCAGSGAAMRIPKELNRVLPSLFRRLADGIENTIARQATIADCPVCETTLCFDEVPPTIVDSRKTVITVCDCCTSFITLERTSNRWRLLTEDEVAEMSDEERQALSRARRLIQGRKGES